MPMSDDPASAVTRIEPDPALSEALALLGKDHLLLTVHGASFPGVAGTDSGRGSPYGKGGDALARFARGLGFTGMLLGPQGQTSPVNASPYDGTLFSRSILCLDLEDLVDQGWLSRQTWQGMVDGNPRPDGRRVAYGYALRAYGRALDEVHARFREARKAGEAAALALDDSLQGLWRSQRWLRDDALYAALCHEHRHLTWRRWPAHGESALDRVLCAPPPGSEDACAVRRRTLEAKHARPMERYALAQTLLLGQHRAFHQRLGALGLKLYGDVQVGFSMADAWSRQSLLLAGYCMGAPPSRTNHEGQPWNYQVLDPDQYLDDQGGPGPVLNFVRERLGKMLAEFDGLRLDHPHGLVCPWVYRADDPDPYHAVQNGARLFSAPDLPDHPALAHCDIADPELINRHRPRYADDWLRDLTPEQEDRYALLMDALMEQAQAQGRSKQDILCEVLSTEPLPLNRVRRRHGLGRFRVTQKADCANPDDVYRSENAEPEDWVMMSTHDTPSIWRLARTWQGRDAGREQAEYLAARLGLDDVDGLARDPARLAHAKMADLFLSPARHVMVFFTDLLGIEDTYNTPGTISDENWTLRVPPDFVNDYERDRRAGRALNLHAALALALRARTDIRRPELVARLESLAGWVAR